MNKRIKKKKAKQAELKRQQELERIFQNPEQVLQYLYVIGIGLENAFNNMAIAFSRLAEEMRKWADAIQQRR